MVLENIPSPDLRSPSQVRQSAVRKRILAQQWCGNAITDLITTAGSIAACTAATPTADYTALITTALNHCDEIETAAHVAAASISVIACERLELATDTARIESEVARDDVEVQRLRRLLSREKRFVDHRKQLEALASHLLQFPPTSDYDKRLTEANAEADAVDSEMASLEKASDAVARELQLMLNCAASLEQSAENMAALLDKPPSTQDVPSTKKDEMDVS